MLMKITNWRKSEFQYLKERMYRKQLEEKIDLYNMYSDVLSHKEKKEFEKLKNEKSHFIVRDREIIARNLINIIDVKNCQYFSQFMNDDLYDKLYDYLIKLSRGNDKAVAHTKLMMEECRPIIEKIEKDEQISNDEFNSFMEKFRVFKRKYLM